MKFLVLVAAIFFSFNIYACPNLQGRYNKCFSEIRKIKGEYIIDQHQESDYEVYTIEYNDDESGDNRTDQLKTNNKIATRKETIPRIGVTVKIEARSTCVDNNVVSKGDAFFLGARVGSFVTKFFIEGNLLKSNVDGSYLGKEVHKRIVCERE